MTNNKLIDSYFAPAGRVTEDMLQEQVKALFDSPIIHVVMEAVSGFAVVLNEQRQVLAANQELIDALYVDSTNNSLIGLRPGEMLGCVHVPEGPDGCGTSVYCQNCGAVIAILACQQNREPSEGECRMTTLKNGEYVAADYKIKATPVKVGQNELSVIVLQDISPYKRREILEKVFLHDFLNMVGGIKGWSEQLESSDPERAARQIISLSTLLKEEVQFHALLARAEKHELEAVIKKVPVYEIFNHIKGIFSLQVADEKKILELDETNIAGSIETDRILLLRVLINMVKNALEATPTGGIVQMGFERQGDRPVFWVHNAGQIPADVLPHIFERSYSTKGNGRGIGTYSIKLFGEQYLKGKTSFESSKETGTTFMIELPQQDILEQKTQPHQAQPVKTEKEDKKVLLVDDDDNQILLGRLLLERLGFLVTTCNEGEDAITLFASAPSDYLFVMTDYSMSPLDGLETARRLLQIQPSVCVLLCTGRDDMELIRAARQVGVRYTALKPATREEMIDLLENAGINL
ncbi:MAG: hybrid sensor histidine kinase/response regulator [Anaerolineae bacterium]|nr:hybrid sensor histidine kinase/response regulator [Anaerolineae bacterium]